MEKLVRYNGKNLSYYGCSDPNVLTEGKIYEVKKVLVSEYHTEYVLKGFGDKEFNSLWFDDISVYTAISSHIPVVGQRYECYKIDMNNGNPRLLGWLTSPVKSFNYIGNNIYDVITKNSRYIVTVG